MPEPTPGPADRSAILLAMGRIRYAAWLAAVALAGAGCTVSPVEPVTPTPPPTVTVTTTVLVTPTATGPLGGHALSLPMTDPESLRWLTALVRRTLVADPRSVVPATRGNCWYLAVYGVDRSSESFDGVVGDCEGDESRQGAYRVRAGSVLAREWSTREDPNDLLDLLRLAYGERPPVLLEMGQAGILERSQPPAAPSSISAPTTSVARRATSSGPTTGR